MHSGSDLMWAADIGDPMTDLVTLPVVEPPLDVPVLPTEPEVDPVLAALRGGRDAVRRGWCQRALERDGSVCALGGMRLAATGSVYRSSGDVGRAIMHLKTLIPTGNLVGFNDDPATTQADVIALFDRGIETWKAR